MRKLIIILLVSNYAIAQTVLLDTNSILIGEQINFSISNKVENTEIWPTYEEFLIEGIEIIKASEIDTSGGIISQQFIITAWDSGSYYIPSITFSAENITEGCLINVQTVTLEEDAELKDIKQPIEESFSWLPWLLAILITVAIYLLLYKWKLIFTNKKISTNQTAKVFIPAHVTALKQLMELENAKVWQEGKIKKYHSKLSEIVRRYTEERFQFIALELTTDEIIDELKSKLNQEQIQNLKTLLQRADLAKFAKSKPIESENTESMLLAKNFVNNTKQKKENE